MLSSKGGQALSYTAQVSCPEGSRSLPHAASAMGANTYSYDCNGNMTQRVIGGSTYNLAYDAENRLSTVSGAASASFVYDGDGVRVKSTAGGTTTVTIGSYFEWTGTSSTMKRYYEAGGSRVGMRQGSTLYWLVSDHLGSTSVTANASGGLYGRLLYKAWGEQRWSSGTTPTTYRYTGQRSESSLGLYYYGARWYDPNLSRWLQPDSIVPLAVEGVQAWDRYAYVNNNPIKYNDPTGHDVGCGGRNADCSPYSNTSDKDRQDYLFSLMFLGSGEDGVWTRSDWEYYYGHKSELWNDPSKWINPDAETGWDLFALQTERLASHYDSSEMDQFVQDFSLVFGGISQEEIMDRRCLGCQAWANIAFSE